MTRQLDAGLKENSLRMRLLSPAQNDRYATAIDALRSSALGSDPRAFRAARDLAIYHCDKARTFNWPEDGIRERRREVAVTWEAVTKAAVKLAVHFEKLDSRIGSARLDAALLQSKMNLRASNKAAPHLAFAKLLRALGKQPEPTDSSEQIGPLKIQQPSHKLPSREVALTIILAHSFNRAASHDGNGPIRLFPNELITSGKAWDAAALFASAALGENDTDPKAAKKFLSTHEGHLYYHGWPEGEAA